MIEDETELHPWRPDSMGRGIDPAPALESIFRREAPDLLRYLRRQVRHDADAADLLSEVFVVAWRRRDDVPCSAPQARMWLFGVARRLVGTHRRGLVRRSRMVERLAAELSVGPDRVGGSGPAADDEGSEDVRSALAGLAERDREIIALVHWDGFSLTEAAVILGIRAGAARTRYQRARQRLRGGLAPRPGDG